MRAVAPITLIIAALAVGACSIGGDADSAEKAGSKPTIDIDFGNDEKAPASGAVNIEADSDRGDLEISMPGGFKASIHKPGGFETKGAMDFDGVGAYPGAKMAGVKVRADAGDGKKDARVELRFSAPGDAAAVADWYQKAFEDKGRSVTRNGETLSGTTRDGEAFTLAMSPAATGSTGLMTIISAGNNG